MSKVAELKAKLEKHQAYYDEKFAEYKQMDESSRSLKRLGRLMDLSNLITKLLIELNTEMMIAVFSNDAEEEVAEVVEHPVDGNSRKIKSERKHVNLSKYVPNFKPNEKVTRIAESLNGLSYKEWQLLKEVIDDIFSSKVANVEFDDFDKLEKRLEFEFSGLGKGQKLLLLSVLNKQGG